MFALTPLAVALQGIGYGAWLTALQGLLAVTLFPEWQEPTPGQAVPDVRRHPRRRAISWSALPVSLRPDIDDEDEIALQMLGMI